MPTTQGQGVDEDLCHGRTRPPCKTSCPQDTGAAVNHGRWWKIWPLKELQVGGKLSDWQLFLAVPDLGTHSSFLAANFSSTFSGLFGSHSIRSGRFDGV